MTSIEENRDIFAKTVHLLYKHKNWHFAFVKRKARLLFVIVKLYKSETVFIRTPCLSKK